MKFEGRDLQELQDKFLDSKEVSFSIYRGQILIRFVRHSGQEFIWPVIQYDKPDEKEIC